MDIQVLNKKLGVFRDQDGRFGSNEFKEVMVEGRTAEGSHEEGNFNPGLAGPSIQKVAQRHWLTCIKNPIELSQAGLNCSSYG
jgi:hypothetical protein